jgi:hypothetical protein
MDCLHHINLPCLIQFLFSCRNEIQTVRAALYVRGLLLLIGKFSIKFAIFIAIVSYALFGNKIMDESSKDSSVIKDICYCEAEPSNLFQ